MQHTSAEIRGEQILTYVNAHIHLQGLTKAMSTGGTLAWHPVEPGRLRAYRARWGIDDAIPISAIQEADRFVFIDAMGQQRGLKVVRVGEGAAVAYYVLCTEPGTNPRFSQFTDLPIVVTHAPASANGYQTVLPNGITLHSNQFMYDHQLWAVHAHGNSLAKGFRDSEDMIVFATGTGKSFIVLHAINAQGGTGIIATLDAALAVQMRQEARTMFPEATIGLGQECLAETQAAFDTFRAQYPLLILSCDDLQRLRSWLHNEHIFIDEVHSFSDHIGIDPHTGTPGLLTQIAAHNNVLAITATPTEAVEELFGEPIITIGMYHALHELNAFRPVIVGTTQAGVPYDEAMHDGPDKEAIERANRWAMIEAGICGYWSHQTFLPAPADATYPTLDAVHANLKARFFPFHDKKNIAFTIRPEIVDDMTAVYNGVFETGRVIIDGRDSTEAFCRKVATARNAAVLRAYLPLLDAHFGHKTPYFAAPARLADLRPEQYGFLLDDLAETGLVTHAEELDLRAEAQGALQTRRAAYLTCAIVPRFTPTTQKETRSSLVAGTLDASLADFSARYRAHQQGVHDPEMERILQIFADDSAHPWEALRALLDDVIDADAIIARLRQGDLRALHIRAAQITRSAGRYAVAIHEGMPTTHFIDTLHAAREGRILHLINNYQLESGYSDPDVYHVQRFIEHLGPHVIRATQIAGRPVRDKDGLAMVHDIVGPNIRLDGERGIDRHFSTNDVLAEDFLAHARRYNANLRRYHPTRCAPVPASKLT